MYKEYDFCPEQIAFIEKKPDTVEFVCDNYFFHFRAGSNYDNQSTDYVSKKWALVLEFVDAMIEKHGK